MIGTSPFRFDVRPWLPGRKHSGAAGSLVPVTLAVFLLRQEAGGPRPQAATPGPIIAVTQFGAYGGPGAAADGGCVILAVVTSVEGWRSLGG